MSSPKVCCGVVGVGSLGQHHARIYASLPTVEFAGIYETSDARAAEICAKYNCRRFATIDDLRAETAAWAAHTNAKQRAVDWQFRTALYGWAQSLDGDVTVRGFTAPVDLKFSDLLQDLDMAFMGLAEVSHGRWGLLLDVNYAKISDSLSLPRRGGTRRRLRRRPPVPVQAVR